MSSRRQFLAATGAGVVAASAHAAHAHDVRQQRRGGHVVLLGDSIFSGDLRIDDGRYRWASWRNAAARLSRIHQDTVDPDGGVGIRCRWDEISGARFLRDDRLVAVGHTQP